MSLAIDLSGRRALVTGVSMGIGLSIAELLARAGCDVAGCALDSAESEEAQRFIQLVESQGRRAHYQQIDLSEPQSPRQWAPAAAEQLGGVDILVSNAGRSTFEGFENCSEDAWQECFDLNLAAHWRLVQAAKPYLDQGTNPVVVAIASIHAYTTVPGAFPYNVAKAGVVALIQSLALELGPHIRAVGIAPGYIQVRPSPPERLDHLARIHPVGRIGQPENIGALCAFLASPWSSFTSGSTFLVDGGRMALMEDKAVL